MAALMKVKVKLNQPRATDRGAEQIGDIIEVFEDEAQRMLAKGQCTKVEEAKEPKRQ